MKYLKRKLNLAAKIILRNQWWIGSYFLIDLFKVKKSPISYSYLRKGRYLEKWEIAISLKFKIEIRWNLWALFRKLYTRTKILVSPRWSGIYTQILKRKANLQKALHLCFKKKRRICLENFRINWNRLLPKNLFHRGLLLLPNTRLLLMLSQLPCILKTPLSIQWLKSNLIIKTMWRIYYQLKRK